MSPALTSHYTWIDFHMCFQDISLQSVPPKVSKSTQCSFPLQGNRGYSRNWTIFKGWLFFLMSHTHQGITNQHSFKLNGKWPPTLPLFYVSLLSSILVVTEQIWISDWLSVNISAVWKQSSYIYQTGIYFTTVSPAGSLCRCFFTASF